MTLENVITHIKELPPTPPPPPPPPMLQDLKPENIRKIGGFSIYSWVNNRNLTETNDPALKLDFF